MSETLVNSEVVTSTKEIAKDDNDDSPRNVTVDDTATAETDHKYDLKNFQLRRVLNNNTRNKSISLLGTFPELSDSDNAIVIFEKQAFEESDVATSMENGEEENGNEQSLDAEEQLVEEKNIIKPSYFCSDLKVQTEFVNNIYGSYRCTPPATLNDVKATVVYPATDKHIEKYSICKRFVIKETPELYKEITLPYITSSQFSLDWVYNILEHKQETERIIFEDPDPENGFILLPDLKWDGRNVENLYVLAITHKRDIKSLRDLKISHLNILRNIRRRVTEVIQSRYGILSNQLRMYFHYQPSFYHLHIHINLVGNDAPGIWCDKSHMLDTVINNLELLPDYYEKATLPFVLYDGNKLLELYAAKSVESVMESIKRKSDEIVAAGIKRVKASLKKDSDKKIPEKM